MEFDFLSPLATEIIDYVDGLSSQQLGNKLVLHTSEAFPEVSKVAIGIIGVLENRGNNKGNPEIDLIAVRKELYSLYPGNWDVSIADFGDIIEGNSKEDTFYALKKVASTLIKNKVIPVVIGGSQDLTYALYRAYDDLEQMVNLVAVDSKFDFGKESDVISSSSYLTKIVIEEPNNLFNYCNIGYQTYYNSQEEIDLVEKLFFDAYRLGEVSNNIAIAEPVFRDADLVSIDMHSVKSSDSGNFSHFIPNGFNGKEIDEEVNGAGNSYDYGVRMYSARLCRWFSVDPKTNLRIEWTPYNYCRNNPKNKTDPTGALDAPIYDENANFLGTDDEGLKGKAIVMNKANFKQGMSHEDALSKSIGVEGFKVKGARTKYLDHYNGLKSRPDYDGYLTWAEANKWYGEGNGQPLFTSLEKIDLSGILSLGENFVGEVDHFNLQLLGNSINDGLVYGSITLKRYPDHQVRAYQDHYDFEMHDTSNPLNWPRNVETLIGKEFAGEGQKFDINIYGSKKLTPILPWIN